MKKMNLAAAVCYAVSFAAIWPAAVSASGQNIPWLDSPPAAETAHKSTVPDCFMGAFFTSNEDLDMACYASPDGIHMTPLFRSKTIAGRDVSLQYYKHNFYVCLVSPEDTAPTFTISRSPDCMTWTRETYTVIERGETNRAIWAPDLFVEEDGSAYVYFAKQREMVKDTGERKFDIYVSVATDIEKGDFSPAVKVELPERSDSYIDAQVRKINGNYYMAVKNEAMVTSSANKSPLLLKSSSPISGFEEVESWPLKYIRGYEGFSITRMGEKVYIYGDNYGRKYDLSPKSHYTVWTADIADIETGPYKAAYLESGRSLRHGSIIPIADDYAKDVLKRLGLKKFQTETKKHGVKKVMLSPMNYGDGQKTADSVTISHFAPAPGVVYIVPKNTRVVIEAVENPYGMDDMSFGFESADDSSLKVLGRWEFAGKTSKGNTYVFHRSGDGKWEYAAN